MTLNDSKLTFLIAKHQVELFLLLSEQRYSKEKEGAIKEFWSYVQNSGSQITKQFFLILSERISTKQDFIKMPQEQ